MKLSNLTLLFLAVLLCINCKKKKSEDPAPTVVVPPTVYYAKYTFRDSACSFSSSKNVLASLSQDEVGCRLYLASDFYNDIEISFIEKTDNKLLTYASLKALEKTHVPIQYNTNANYESGPTAGICVSLTYATPKESYFSDNVDQEDQKGSFYIESVKQIPSSRFSPNTKRCEIKGTFSCTLNGNDDTNYELTNGTYYLLYEFWPE